MIRLILTCTCHRGPWGGPICAGSLLAVLLLVCTVPARAWETVFVEGGVRVQRRPFADSVLMEVRGRVRVAASLNALMALLKDADFNHRWVYRSGGARILQASEYSQAYVYGIVDAPWPMRDRDTVVRFDYRQNPETLEILISITNFPDFVPQQAGLIRVPQFGGFWKLTPLPGGEVDVVYQVHGDPGGRVPAWLANYAAALSVSRTLQNMPTVVQLYSAARSDLVREPEANQETVF